MTVTAATPSAKVAAVLAACTARGTTIATVESCTGGLLAAALTELPGASRVFTHGFVTYANDAKIAMAGVKKTLLEAHGAVSEPVARAMAEGGLRVSGASMAVAITGIAGPDGGSEAKPVGTVHIALAVLGGPTQHQHLPCSGNRSTIRAVAVQAALDMLLAALNAE